MSSRRSTDSRSGIQIQSLDKGYDGLSIWDHAQIATNGVIAQGQAH